MPEHPAVVFDLGKVLLDFDFARAANALQQHCSLTSADIQTLIDQSPLLHRYETGLITTEEFFDEVRNKSGFCKELGEFAPLFGDIFSPVQEMTDFQESLRTRGIKTYIFSNTSSLAIDHIRERYPFFANFDGYVLSYEARCMKPQPQIYEAVERLTGRQGADLIYIDDRLENIETAQGRGWNAIHHLSPINTIPQVEELLQKRAALET